MTGFDRGRTQTASIFERSGAASRRLGSMLVIGLALLVAYRSILIEPFVTDRLRAFESWFFLPGSEAGLLSVLVAAWLFWNRKDRLLECSPPPIRAGTLAAAAGASALVVGLHAWALMTGVLLLMILSLVGLIATIAAMAGGRVGLRRVLMPCLALLIVAPYPDPLVSEIVWQLQLLTAHGTRFFSELAGFPVMLEGTELRRGEHVFLIIQACSGWRGIQILSLVALVAADLRGLSLRATLAVILAAWPIGMILNIARAGLVVLTQEELDLDLFSSHTPQGLAVLLVGSATLYGVTMLFASRREEPRVETPHVPARARWVALFGIGLSGLVAISSVALPLLGATWKPPAREPISFPLEHGPWVGTPLPVDYFFPYESALHAQWHAEYRKPFGRDGTRLVDLLVVREMPLRSGLNRIPDSKLVRPASSWNLDRVESQRLWQLGRDGREAILSREAGSERTLVIAWRLRDSGLVGESLESLLGLDACPRIVVRMAVPIVGEGRRGRDRAMASAQEFLRDFADPLEALARSCVSDDAREKSDSASRSQISSGIVSPRHGSKG